MRQITIALLACAALGATTFVGAGEKKDQATDRAQVLKMLALSFLILIGVMLVADGFDKHIERGFIYFAMLFALAVELLNLKAQKKRAAAHDDRGAGLPVSPPPGPEK
jgi:predicted tellurium resistance membrane protein TerC